MQCVGTLAGLARVESGIGFAGRLLRLERLGAVVPIADLLGQTVLYGRFGLGDQAELSGSDLIEMLRYDMCDSVALRSLFEVATDPGAFGTRQQRIDSRLGFRQWPVVEIRCI